MQQLRDEFGSLGTVQVALEMYAEGSWPQQVRQAAALAVGSLCCRHPQHQRLFRKADVSPTQCARAVQMCTHCARLQQLLAQLWVDRSAGEVAAAQGACMSFGRQS